MNSFERRLLHLASRDYPTAVATTFIKALFADLEDRRTRVSALVADYASDPRGAEDQLRSEHRMFVLRFPLLDAVENAQTQRIPWSLAPSIEFFAGRLFPGKHLLTSADSAYNYSMQYWKPTATGRLTDFYILRLPSLHRLDALLHTLIGHELFHPILSPFLDAAQSAALGPLRDKCSQLLQSQPQLGPLFDAKRLDRVLEVTRTIWRRALEELMCDMGCVVLFGPAAVLAVVTFALGDSLDTAPISPRFYPPFRFRFRTMLKYGFAAAGYATDLSALTTALSSTGELADTAAVFNDQWKLIETTAASSDDLAAIDSDPLTQIAYSEVDGHLPNAWKFIRDLPSSKDLCWTRSQAEIPLHLKACRQFVPTGEVRNTGDISGPPATPSAIVISAWLQALQSERRLAQEPVNVALDDYLRSARLLLKSLEDAELKRLYVTSTSTS